MTKRSMTLAEMAGNVMTDGNRDMIQVIVQQVLAAIMEAEVSQLTGADHGERSDARATYRNGYRPRDFDTRVGTVPLAIPKVREGTYCPRFLEPRRRAEGCMACSW